MRTTVTLDPDVEHLIKEAMRKQGVSFKEAVNDAIRNGLAPRTQKPFTQRTFAMGRPEIDYTKALQIAATLEDQETIRELAVGR